MSGLFKNEYEKHIVIENFLSKLESDDITEEELQQCIDDELIKPESEMDTELIDLCASALCTLYGIEIKETPMYKPWEEAEKKKARLQNELFKG